MKKIFFIAIVTVMAMMASCDNKQEGKEAENSVAKLEDKQKIEQELPATMKEYRIGRQLALYGYTNQSPEALIEAANILANVSVTNMDTKVQHEGKSNKATGDKEGNALDYSPKGLLALARTMAKNDAHLLAMADKVDVKLNSMEGERGASDGVQNISDRIFANDNDIVQIKFKAHELAACMVVGDGTTDLDLYIYDSNGNLVADDTDYSDQCFCSWIPEKEETFTIKIINRGSVYNDYTLTTD